MKYMIATLCMVVLAGCAQPNRPVTSRDTLNPLSPQEVAEVQQALSDLKAGMEMQEVLTLLRKTPFKHAVGSRSGGPTSSRHTVYHLRQGANLVLSFDYTGEKPILVSAEQAGDAWPKNEKERSSNKPVDTYFK